MVEAYIHIMDIAVGHTAALPFCTSHKGVEVINLGTGRGHSVLELISAFENATGIHIPFQIVGRRAGDIPVCFASAEKGMRCTVRCGVGRSNIRAGFFSMISLRLASLSTAETTERYRCAVDSFHLIILYFLIE